MSDRRKRCRVLHVNMLKEWHAPVDVACVTMESAEEEEEVVAWKDEQVDGE